MKKPVIGIVAKHKRADENRLNTFIRDEVEQAVFDNGGIAIGILPPNMDKTRAKDNWQEQLTTEEKHNFYDQINLCDGVILQGGDFTDEYECFVAKYCYDYDIPLLGICAGKHNIIRALGGTIEKISGSEHYKTTKDYVHKITINKNSKAYKIIGKEEVMVNSRHNNHSSSIKNLDLVAEADDGIDEIVEDPTKKFFMGVQFHPESLYKTDIYMNNIFTNFIKTCKKEK